MSRRQHHLGLTVALLGISFVQLNIGTPFMYSLLAAFVEGARIFSSIALLLRLCRMGNSGLSGTVFVTPLTSGFGLSSHLELVVGVINVRHLLRDNDVRNTSVVLARHPHRCISATLSELKAIIARGIMEHRLGLYVILLHCNHVS